MHKDIQFAPVLTDGVEYCFQLSWDGNVKSAGNRGFEFLCQWLDVWPGPFVQPGNRKVRSHRPERLCAAICNRLVIRDADNERLLAGKDLPDIPLAHRNLPSTNGG